jgi:uncharacterized membrane protein HdeD (DUF308 family)
MAVMSMSSPRWGLVLLQGIVSIIFGVLLLLATGMTVTAAVVFLGAYWLVMGIIAIIGIFVGYTRAHWGWALFSGILGIIAGILILGHPLTSAVIVPAILVMILASLGIIMGIVAIIQGAMGAGWAAIVLGILSIILGILIFIAPIAAAFIMILMLGIFLVIGGIAAMVGAFQIRSAAKKAKA